VPTITLKDIPRDLHRDLKKRAEAHHRSLNKEVIATLQAATAGVVRFDALAAQRAALSARASFKRPVSAREISLWKRRGRL
jgi:plasmid stability protein